MNRTARGGEKKLFESGPLVGTLTPRDCVLCEKCHFRRLSMSSTEKQKDIRVARRG